MAKKSFLKLDQQIPTVLRFITFIVSNNKFKKWAYLVWWHVYKLKGKLAWFS